MHFMVQRSLRSFDHSARGSSETYSQKIKSGLLPYRQAAEIAEHKAVRVQKGELRS